jgi:negative regulator of replication initiation
MYYMMFKTAREAMQSEDKEVRAAAMRQIAGVYASAGLMAGVQGLPMFGIMAAVYNLFKGDDEDDAETAARKYLGEGLFNGAVNYLTGTAVANRIGLSDLLISSTGYKEQDNAMLAFMQLIGGPVYGVADRIQQGVKLINEGETERGLERMLPAGIANGFKGIRFATEGANTLRGDPITGEMTPANVTAQFFGFAPAEYTRQLEINAFEKTKDRRATKERTKILQNYYISARSGDSEGMSDAVNDMLKFSAKHPAFAITAETVKNSMAQHQRTTQQMYNGVLFNKNMRDELIQDAAEFDGGLFSDE